jgi:light-regulated signal transduction histidine kinase (bacteriophytochrome)
MTMTQDITESKKAEEALRSRAEELARLTTVLAQTTAILEKRNIELDQFAYIVSHDLKAPLRAIANLSVWLEEDLAPYLTEDTRHQMDLMQGRVHRMEALINGLLQYSRIGRISTASEVVDVEALLAEVIDSLAPPPEFTVTVMPGMPMLMTERLPLEQVFANLISNGIKHNHRPDGQIVISVEEQTDFYEFAVADNGPGIAPEFHNKVFVIFQTLQPRDTVENTGVGLAIVKKIIEDKGGTIALESQPNQGATFRFTWPKQSMGRGT